MSFNLKHSILFLSFLSLFFSCENKKENDFIVVTTNIIGNSLQEIIQNDVEIVMLMNSETDPHSYEPSPYDYQMLNSTKVIVSNGLHLEGKLHEVILQTVKTNSIKAIFMSDGLQKKDIIFEEGKIADPHIWMDVDQWKRCIRYAVEQLKMSYPQHAEIWETRLKQYEEKLVILDTEVQTGLNSIPDSSRVLVSAHDAFSYLSKRYKIEIQPLQGRNTMSEPSINDVIELSQFIVDRKIKSIFVESTVNKKFIESIKENCIKKGHQVNIGGELYSDALGPEGTPESSYIGMIQHNLNTVVNALK